MSFNDFGRFTARHWILIVASTVFFVVAASILFYFTPRTYLAEASGRVVGQQISAENADSAVNLEYADMLIGQTKAHSYAAVMQSEKIYVDASSALGGAMTPTELRQNSQIDLPKDSVTIWVRTRAHSPKLANQAAFAVVEATASEVRRLEGDTAPYLLRPVRSAQLPRDPVSPQYVLYFFPALVLGVAVGYLLALLRQQVDHRLRQEADLAQVPGAVYLGMLPAGGKDETSGFGDFLNFVDSANAAAQAEIRKICTNLQFSQVDSVARTFTVTSAKNGEGKSTLALNLALAMARRGSRVVVVETDLRHPTLAQQLRLDVSAGLVQVLAGEARLEQALVSTPMEGVEVLVAGRTEINASEMLGSRRMRELVSQLAQDRVVICDCAAVGAVTDPVVLASITDAVVVAVQRGRTRVSHLQRALLDLSRVRARVLGCVLVNSVRR